MRALVVFTVLFASMFHHGPARAGDPAAAEALFDEGRRLMREGELDAACEKLAASMEEDAAVGTLLNLGQCNEKRGRTATAWLQYQDAEKLAKRREEPERAEVARALAGELEASLSRVTIEVTDFVEGMIVERNGKRLQRAAFGVAVPVDPGRQRVEVTAPGKTPWSVEVHVRPAQNETITIPTLAAAKPSAANAASFTPEQDETGSGFGTLGYAGITVTVVGLAVLGAGIALGALAQSDRDAALSHCPENACDEMGFDLVESARTKAHGSTAAFVIGGTALTGGVIMMVGGAF